MEINGIPFILMLGHIMKKAFQILFVLIILLSCSKQIQLIGTYKSESPSYIKKIWKYYTQGYTSYAIGAEIILKKDSIFDLITCANIINGKWYCMKDSLYLVYETNRWRNDSLQKYGYEGKWPQIPQKPFALKIKRNKLLWHMEGVEEGKAYKTLNILKK